MMIYLKYMKIIIHVKNFDIITFKILNITFLIILYKIIKKIYFYIIKIKTLSLSFSKVI